MSRDRAPRVFLGRLPRDARERDVEKFFRGFGRIREINLKNGFGFVVSTEFESVLKSLNYHRQPKRTIFVGSGFRGHLVGIY